MAGQTETKRDIICNIDQEKGILSLHFSNGKKIQVLETELHDKIKMAAMWHGLKQKLVDAAAMSRNTTTGRSASIEDKFEAVNEVYQRITSLDPQWNATRGGGGAEGGLLLQAMCRLYPRKTKEELTEFLSNKSKAEQAALRENTKIKPIIDQIKSERVNTDIDTDSILGELEDE